MCQALPRVLRKNSEQSTQCPLPLCSSYSGQQGQTDKKQRDMEINKVSQEVIKATEEN